MTAAGEKVDGMDSADVLLAQRSTHILQPWPWVVTRSKSISQQEAPAYHLAVGLGLLEQPRPKKLPSATLALIMDILGVGIDYDHVCNWLAAHHPVPTVPPLPSSGHPHSSTSPLPVIPHPPPVATHPPSASQPPVPPPIFSTSSPVMEPSKGACSSTWDYKATAQYDMRELEMILREDIEYQFPRWPHETDDAYEK